jgi:5,10-methylenetetrahydrofolate reductase
LQSDLLGAAALGLSNLLVLRGDAPLEPLKEEKCFDLNTEDLIQAITALKSGKDLDGNDLKEGVPDYCAAAAAHPGVPNLAAQKETMLKRMDMGVEFFQTQICFEKGQIDKFIESIGDELASKTILGITPLKALAQANFMNKNIFGVTVPDSHLERMQKALGDSDPKSEQGKASQQKQGLELARDLVSYIKTTPLKGIHIMAIGQEDVLEQIIKSIV